MRTIALLAGLALITACGADGGPAGGDDTAVTPTDGHSSHTDDATAPDEDVTTDLADSASEDVPAGPGDEDAPVQPSEDAQAPTEDGATEPGDATAPPQDVTDSPDDTTTTTPPEPDTSGPGDPEEETLCGVLCEKLNEDCDGYELYGADEAGCLAACEEMALISLDSLIGLACLSDTCNASQCEPGDTPFVVPAVCHAACGLLEACDLLGVIEPEHPDMVELCILGCASGHVVAPEFMPNVAECIAEGLEQGCDPTIVEQCVPQDPGPGGGGGGGEIPTCAEICDIAMNFKCPPWSDGPKDWPDIGACMADCALFEADAEASASTLHGCVMAASCDDMGHCTTPPSGDDAACVKACTEVFGLCGPDFMPSMDFCNDYCTGQLMIFGATTTAEEVSICLDSAGLSCEQDPFGTVLGCLLDFEAECTTICDALTSCDGGTLEGCVEPCNAGYMSLFSGKPTADLAACMTEAADDCDAIQGCMSGPSPPPCYALCNSGQACEPNPEMCEAACDTKVADGKLADIACEFADKCQTAGLCEGLQVDAAPTECLEACDSAAESTCSAYEGGCVAACHGLMAGNAGTDPMLPFCMVPQLGESCAIDAAYWVCQQ